MNFIYTIIALTTLFSIALAQEEAKPRFFLGEMGDLECDGGVPVTDKATCEIGCLELELPLGNELSDGFLCFQGNGGKGRGKGKGRCNQGGNNGNEARLVCEKQPTLMPECYGGDIHEPTDLVTLKDCISGCKGYEDCMFITYGPGRCIFKNGLTSVHDCEECDSHGHCDNEGDCDIETEFCSVNM